MYLYVYTYIPIYVYIIAEAVLRYLSISLHDSYTCSSKTPQGAATSAQAHGRLEVEVAVAPSGEEGFGLIAECVSGPKRPRLRDR